MVRVIASRELRSLFCSPLAWVMLGVVQFVLAWLFLSQVDVFLQFQSRLAALPEAPGVTQLVVAPLYGNAALVLLLVVPLLTMRLISDERRGGTLTLLFAAPLSMTQIVLGKYLGLMVFLSLMTLLVALMPLALLAGTTLDWGWFAAMQLGLLLLVAGVAALGLFMSPLSAHPAVAAVSGFGALLFLWLLDWAGEQGSLLGHLSLMRHYQALAQGVFDSTDVLYYLLFIVTFLALSIERLDAQRRRS